MNQLSWVVLVHGLPWGCSQVVSQGWSYLKAPPWLEDPLPLWLTHMTDMLVLVVGQVLQYLSLWASPQGCLSVLTEWHLPSCWGSNPRGHDRGSNPFYDLASEVTHCNCHHVLMTAQASPDSVWKETVQQHEHWEVMIWRPMLENWLSKPAILQRVILHKQIMTIEFVISVFITSHSSFGIF